MTNKIQRLLRELPDDVIVLSGLAPSPDWLELMDWAIARARYRYRLAESFYRSLRLAPMHSAYRRRSNRRRKP